MANRRTRWTAEDDDLLRELWASGAELNEMAETLERDQSKVLSRAAQLGLPGHRQAVPWTRVEIDTLRNLFARGLSDAEIAARLDNRSLNAIVRQRNNLGLVRRARRSADRSMSVVGPARTCQWIEGDPKASGSSVCGKPSLERTSYCAEHARRVFRPADPNPVRIR